MTIEDERRIRKERKQRIKAKKRKARRRGFFFLLLLLIIGSLGIKFIKHWSESRVDISKANEAQWYILKDLGLEKTINPRMAENLVNINRDVIHNKLEIRLLKGKNHINIAEDYAFDAKEVREYLNGDKVYKGKEKWAFLTFDDGPNQTITPQILDILKENEVPGTFFVVGKSITEKNKNVLMREISEGHGIALHSFYHEYKDLYPGRVASEAQITKEAKLTQEALQNIISADFHSSVWRYPGGHMSWKGLDGADAALSALDIDWIDWNTLSGDAEHKSVRPTTSSGMVDYLKNSLAKSDQKNFAVVLMHDAENKSLTVEALPYIIKELKEQGYSFGILK